MSTKMSDVLKQVRANISIEKSNLKRLDNKLKILAHNIVIRLNEEEYKTIGGSIALKREMKEAIDIITEKESARTFINSCKRLEKIILEEQE